VNNFTLLFIWDEGANGLSVFGMAQNRVASFFCLPLTIGVPHSAALGDLPRSLGGNSLPCRVTLSFCAAWRSVPAGSGHRALG